MALSFPGTVLTWRYLLQRQRPGGKGGLAQGWVTGSRELCSSVERWEEFGDRG